jgi:CelD/BcsL family acetyltransferase involved in cellulose biosynthesis
MTITAEPRPAPPRAAAPPAPVVAGPSVVVLDDVAALAQHVPAWEQLAAQAVEPNTWQEPWLLLPALRAFAGERPPLFVLVYGSDPTRPQGPPLLLGLFPLERRRRYKGLPLSSLRLWQHLHCFDCTPLVRAGRGPECLGALFDWLAGDRRGSALLELNFVAADGPFHHLFVEDANQHRRLAYVEETISRALLRPAADGESYLQAALSTGNRKELRRQRRRLGELGRLETRVLDAGGDLERWLADFLALEEAGWKGEAGTALARHANDRTFFLEAARAAFATGRLMLLGLFLDDRPVAMKCNFLAGAGSLAFKIAYDENFARFSPGVQLELDNVLEFHARQALRWMDSCAVSQHFMINRLWKDRRVLQTVLVSTGRRGGDLTVSALPLLRWLRRLVRRQR